MSENEKATIAEEIKNEAVNTAEVESSASERKNERKKAALLKKQAKQRIRDLKKRKKEILRAKKIVPVEKRPIICPPDTEVPRSKVIIGLVCRAAVLFFAVFGMTLFISDALGILRAGVTAFSLALWALIFVAALTLCVTDKTKKIAIPAFLLLLTGGGVFLATQGVYRYLLQSTVNCVIDHLYSRGYLALVQYRFEYMKMPFTTLYLLNISMAIITLIYATVYVLCLMRRIKIALPAVVSALTLVPIFVYNLTRSNWGVALVTAAFSGILVMAVFDRMYQRKPKTDEYDTETKVIDDPFDAIEAYSGKTQRELKKQERIDAAAKKKTAKKLAAEEKKAFRKRYKKADVNADEDISDYFGNARKKSELNIQRSEKKSAALQKKAEKQKQRAEKQAEKQMLAKMSPLERKAFYTAKNSEISAKKAELRRSDREVLKKRSEIRARVNAIDSRRASAGGFAGATMLLVALAILIIPAATVSDKFRLIEAIDDKMEYYREYVTALLMGDDPLLDELAYEGRSDSFAPRSTEATHPVYTGIKIMHVDSPSTSNIYLRGWIATGYDTDTGSWYTADPKSDAFLKYRETFGTAFDPSETMLYNLYRYYDPGAVAERAFEDGKIVNYSSTYGFSTMQINMRREYLSSYLVYMPSFYSRRYSVPVTVSGGRKTYALRDFGKAEAENKITYTNYFDGIYTGYRLAKDENGYAAVASVSNMKNPLFYKNVAKAIVTFNQDRLLIEADRAAKAESQRKYGVVQSKSGEFWKVAGGDEATYTIVRPTGETVYSRRIDAQSGNIIIEMPMEGGTAVYTCNPQDGSVKSKRGIPDDPENEITYGMVPALPPIINYLEFYTEAERAELSYAWRISDLYTNFVYETYTGRSDSKIIKDILNEIVGDEYPQAASRCAQKGLDPYVLTYAVDTVEVYEQRHKMTMAIIKWMKENCTYTLTPLLSDNPELDGVEKFLFETREGYCVQFASSLALMLREAGIPARYVEGYIVTDFYRQPYTGNFGANVLDKNAHAWVEVWYDGIGWMQYEATPPYYSDMYELISEEPSHVIPGSQTGDEDDDGGDEPDVGLTDEELAELIRQQEEEEKRRRIAKIITVSLVLAAVAAIFTVAAAVINRKAKLADKKRASLIEKLKASATRGEAPIEYSQAKEMVRQYGDMLSLLLSECGCAPESGEFREDYALRIHRELEEFLRVPGEGEGASRYEISKGTISASETVRIFNAIAAAEFGGEGSADELFGAMPDMARLWERLYSGAYKRRVHLSRRLFLHLIKNTL